ncbi:unnamed protein product [Clonostachys chloroleuca]|uniref:Uncharacterized protein n=1 Tax=Clonostachys chloroleuca TaxID=1926264 RepID=A0AA35LZC4_9HYPO|nr:unnamed protein product [Clonostachys chloroleuca]
MANLVMLSCGLHSSIITIASFNQDTITGTSPLAMVDQDPSRIFADNAIRNKLDSFGASNTKSKDKNISSPDW